MKLVWLICGTVYCTSTHPRQAEHAQASLTGGTCTSISHRRIRHKNLSQPEQAQASLTGGTDTSLTGGTGTSISQRRHRHKHLSQAEQTQASQAEQAQASLTGGTGTSISHRRISHRQNRHKHLPQNSEMQLPTVAFQLVSIRASSVTAHVHSYWKSSIIDFISVLGFAYHY